MLLQFLEGISNLISAGITFVVHMFTMLLMIITTIPTALTYIFNVVAFLPPYILSVVTVSVSLAVILFIINR